MSGESPSRVPYNLFHDCKPEPSSLRAGRMAFAEDLITVIFGDSQPIIHHVESIVKVAYC